jgi:hypothetical protein
MRTFNAEVEWEVTLPLNMLPLCCHSLMSGSCMCTVGMTSAVLPASGNPPSLCLPTDTQCHRSTRTLPSGRSSLLHSQSACDHPSPSPPPPRAHPQTHVCTGQHTFALTLGCSNVLRSQPGCDHWQSQPSTPLNTHNVTGKHTFALTSGRDSVLRSQPA